ncbi:MAG TPA: YhjD/YihY/BrkB family envelope integrity protein [Candidatus Limnocylindrales bacterium]|nr:YhjD/YihY/BrkB family envelope integrity protein [Candidatus Limnocylindrales bacterium]
MAIRPLLRRPVVREARAVLADDGEADGSLLSAGLAFRALFAILPALLLLTGLVGLLVGDPERRLELLGSVLDIVPGPLVDPFRQALEALARGGSAFSIIGLATLAWGASGFYGQLDAAMARLIPGPRRRGMLTDRLRGLAAVGAVAAAVVLGAVAAAAWSILAARISLSAFPIAALAGGVAAAALLLGCMDLAVYRLVPVAAPDLAAALAPALVSGLAQAVATVSFAILAPWLIGSLATFGALVGLLAAMIWLELMARLLVLGASWARRRRDRATGASGAARAGGSGRLTRAAAAAEAGRGREGQAAGDAGLDGRPGAASGELGGRGLPGSQGGLGRSGREGGQSIGRGQG